MEVTEVIVCEWERQVGRSFPFTLCLNNRDRQSDDMSQKKTNILKAV